MTNKKECIEKLVETWGGRFSEELGIDSESGRSDEIFKWFLASVLFGTRIRQDAARETYRQFEINRILTPDKILETGWDGLVAILDAGGYARYDFKTATKLLDIAGMLNAGYRGDLNRLHRDAKDSSDLEARLMEFKGVGAVTANIFLREMRGVWEKADPLPGDIVVEAAVELGFTIQGDRRKVLADLKKVWEDAGRPCPFPDFEAALVRYGINLRRQRSRKS